MTTTVLTVPTNVFAAFAKIAPKKDIRYYLNGVFVEPDTGAMVCTTGHVLLAHATGARVPDVAPFIIPVALFTHLLKTKFPCVRVSITSGDVGKRTITLEGVRAIDDVEPSGATFQGAEIEGRYPDWRRAVPVSASGEMGHLNPEYLATVADALKLLAGYKGAMVETFHNGPHTAAVLTVSGSDSLGVVMPFRGSKSPDMRPFAALKLTRTSAPADDSGVPAADADAPSDNTEVPKAA